MKQPRYYILIFGLLLLATYQSFSLHKHYLREKEIIINDIRNAIFLADYSEISHRIQHNLKKDTCISGSIDNSAGITPNGHVSYQTIIKFNDIKKPSIVFNATTPHPVAFKSLDEYQTFNSISFIGLHSGVDHLVPINIFTVDSLFNAKLKHDNIHVNYRLSVVRLDRDKTPVDSIFENPLYFFTKELPDITERYCSFGDSTINTFSIPQMERSTPMWISRNGDTYLYNYELSGQFAYLVEINNIDFVAISRISHIILFSIFSTLIIIILIVALIYKNNKLLSIKEREKRIMQDMTHELKTPIAVSLAAVETLSDNEFPPTEEKRIKYLNIIRSKLLQLNNQISRILSPHQKTASMTSTNLHDAIHKIVREAQLRVSPNGMITIDIPNDISVPIPIEDINRIFSNMLDNAIKYCKNAPVISISVFVTDGIITVRITDNGSGISDNDLPHIFKRHYRGSDLSTGSGLGLADVKETLDKYNSSISVVSTSEDGTTFELKIKQ